MKHDIQLNELLLEAAAIIGKVNAELFDMENWRGVWNKKDGIYDPYFYFTKKDCGTVGCALGWLPGSSETFETIEKDYQYSLEEGAYFLSFREYGKRVFKGLDNSFFDFIFSPLWKDTANSPKEAATRMKFIAEWNSEYDTLLDVLGLEVGCFDEDVFTEKTQKFCNTYMRANKNKRITMAGGFSEKQWQAREELIEAIEEAGVSQNYRFENCKTYLVLGTEGQVQFLNKSNGRGDERIMQWTRLGMYRGEPSPADYFNSPHAAKEFQEREGLGTKHSRTILVYAVDNNGYDVIVPLMLDGSPLRNFSVVEDCNSCVRLVRKSEKTNRVRAGKSKVVKKGNSTIISKYRKPAAKKPAAKKTAVKKGKK